MESSVAEKDGLLAEREAALAAKDSAMASLTTQAQDLRAANERTGWCDTVKAKHPHVNWSSPWG